MDTEKSKETAILIHSHTDSPFVIRQIIYLHNYLNHYFSTYMHSMLTVEPVEDGIVYIFKDRQAFEIMHIPIEKLFLEQIDKQIKNGQNPIENFLQSLDELPKNGVCIDCYLSNLSVEDAFPIMKKYYHSIHPDIELIQKENRILIKHTTYQSFIRYLQVVASILKNSEII